MSYKPEPFISIIIPVYNLENYIAEAIQSVLIQNYAHLEIIIVNDGSNDSTEREVGKCQDDRIMYLKQTQQGAASARNHGVRAAKGEWIAFLDADDLWLPGKLQAQLELLEQQQNLEMIFTFIQEFISPELKLPNPETYQAKNRILPGHCTSTLLIKKETFLKVGYFNEQRCIGEFLEWYLKSKTKGLVEVMLPTVLVKRRLHLTNTSHLHKKSRKEYVHILQEQLFHEKK